MSALVDEIAAQVLTAERLLRPRTRARKAKDAETFRRTVEALVCDLSYRHLLGGSVMSVPRGKHILARRSRYRSPALGEQLRKVLDLMATRELAFIVQRLGTYAPDGNAPTLIEAGPRLLSRIEDRGITLADIGRHAGEELIVLASVKDDGGGRRVEYDDNETTNRYRAEIRRINAALAAADIEYTGPGNVDTRARHLIRRFTRSSFESGGRLWGGFWLSLPKRHRLDHVRIDGEPVVSLDYSGMVVRTAYALVGAVPPPEGDAYDLGSPPSLSRQITKKALSACLFASRPLTRWPGELTAYATVVPWRSVLDAIKAKHPALEPVLGSGLGHRAQFIESQILVGVLLRLLDHGITALPVHDCVVVPESGCDVAEQIMHVVFTEHTGLPALVKPERPEWPLAA